MHRLLKVFIGPRRSNHNVLKDSRRRKAICSAVEQGQIEAVTFNSDRSEAIALTQQGKNVLMERLNYLDKSIS